MDTRGQEIAIIGTACRFPGESTSPARFWESLCDPKLLASDVPALKGYYHQEAQYHGHANVREAYLLTGDGVHRRFDASFFGISPSEATMLDPQIRLLLEVVYEALEAGGQTIHQLKGSNTAVYAGQMVNDYELQMYRDHENLGKYHATGTSRAMLSNRVSYFFDWHGPSVTVDTACSSSLVALHCAVQQLRSGGSRIAVVAGSNLIYDAGTFIAETNLQMLSPDGRSRMWDADANGYARGEGVAALILKTRSAAEADGDHIECIVRETALNQDGRTRGQAMPSAKAQAQLIKDCYSLAGLDLANPAHRPQFFEAHGTGTPAGDPIEAEAISSALFPDGLATCSSFSPLFVGSCKTVIGHTEGAAGLAGILKASLAIQNAKIPPNLHFHRLNPKIQPFYGRLLIPNGVVMPWPTMTGHDLRRVSVNSFGFGGTNAHAIVESYVPPCNHSQLGQSDTTTFSPFVFSAACEFSLQKYLKNFVEFLQLNGDVLNFKDIAYTLEARRTKFPVALAVSASTATELINKIHWILEAAQNDREQSIGVRTTRLNAGPDPNADKPRILGVFTGQGAQWAQMGLDLITKSTTAKRIFGKLQRALDRLPEDRPTWSLLQELQKDASSTRIMSTAWSQPLCTAIQIVQIDLLCNSGLKFSAVVGHSSGEIAAAYAAGLISAEDAIGIAYYRGLHSQQSQGINKQRGMMLAVGTSEKDAQELLEFDEFRGRACIAAVNSRQSVTLSGDSDAIEELAIIFEDEEKFARILRVDTAYHSHHMNACSARYLNAIRGLDIQVGSGNATRWFSSVSGGEISSDYLLRDTYWERNMVMPVLFKQALDAACHALESYDLVVEVGPHPALKRPALETIWDRLSSSVPYTSLFQRGLPSITTISDSLGFAWIQLGHGAVNLQRFDRFMSGPAKVSPRLVTELPLYAWDHRNEYWHETRYARAVRLRKDSVHELLGHLTPDSTELDMRWRHMLQPSEITWLADHRLHNGIVFPASAFAISVLEASLIIANTSATRLLELLDFNIVSPLVFESENTRIETILSLTNITRLPESLIEAEFKFHAAPTNGNDELRLKARGRVRVHLGSPDEAALPLRTQRLSNLTPVHKSSFYDSMSQIGYHYSGPFKALDRIERKMGAATGAIMKIGRSDLLLHPAVLDAAFHSSFVAYAAPDDGSLSSIQVPRKIQCLTVNPGLCMQEKAGESPLEFDTILPNAQAHSQFVCNISIYPSDKDHGMVQIQGLECVPLLPPTEKEDKFPFCELIWDVEEPDVQLVLDNWKKANPLELKLATVLERTASFYLQFFEQEIPAAHPLRGDRRFENLFRWSIPTTMRNTTLWQPEWEHDTFESLDLAQHPFKSSAELKVLLSLCSRLVEIVKDYQAATSVPELAGLRVLYPWDVFQNSFLSHLAQVVKQMVHRNPHMHILELVSETMATNTIIDEICSKFSSYTVAMHPSTRRAADNNPVQTGPIMEKVLLKEWSSSEDLRGPGIADTSEYDLIVATLALHAETDLKQSLCNLRRLLKPGGYLAILEAPSPTTSPLSALVCTFADYGSDVQKKRKQNLPANLAEWDYLLCETGFSGIDTSSIADGGSMQFCIFVSQALDENIAFLRQPLATIHPSQKRLNQGMVIFSGTGSKAATLASQVSAALGRFCGNIQIAESCQAFLDSQIMTQTVILSVVDSDETFFKDLTSQKWETLKKMAVHSGTLVWVTNGRRAQDPYANMVIGLLRGAVRDNPALDYLLLDFEGPHNLDHANIIAESVLRHRAAIQWRHRDILQPTVENELVVDEMGRFLIPRLVVSPEMCDRYNSSRREIRSLARPRRGDLGVSIHNSKWDLTLQPSLLQDPLNGGLIELRTTYSLLSPVRVAEFGCMFVVLGVKDASGDEFVALSSKNNSSVSALESLALPIKGHWVSSGRFLWLIAQYLITSIALRGLTNEDRILVHEPSDTFARIITQQAGALGVPVKFTTTRSDLSRSVGNTWIALHPAVPDACIERLVQDGVSVFIDFTRHAEVGTIGHKINAALPVFCRRETFDSLFGRHAFQPSHSHVRCMRSKLRLAVDWASTVSLAFGGANSLGDDKPVPITLASFNGVKEHTDPLTVVDWRPVSDISVKACPVESLVTFPDSRTYWLVGLTGGLGLSLCEWMAKRGARHFVISSRNPDIEAKWLLDMSEKGCSIKIATCDVTQKKQVEDLHLEISSTMPPIAGVAQGVMVLEDTAIQDMTLNQFLVVTQPKVQGSIHLNELFLTDALDFFIFFSSVSTIVGNYGQANYAAANSFMTSLAEQRRRQGLAASVISIGAIAGIGYISRAFRDSELNGITMRISGLAKTSERDFHQIFGEAVLAGRPGSYGSAEVISGLRELSYHDSHQPVWYSWPRMSHLIQRQQAHIDPASRGDAGMSVKSRLAKAADIDVYDIIYDLFANYLGSQFLLNIADVNKPETAAMRFDQLGIDSLTAVEVRGWFIKTLEVNIPVLTILNGSAIGDLVATATEIVLSRRNPIADEPSTVSGTSGGTFSSTAADMTQGHGYSEDEYVTSTTASIQTFGPDEHDSQLEILRSIPVSFTQARFYPSGLFLDDRVGLNHTAWAKISGTIDPEKLRAGVHAVSQQHEILRTAFFDQDSKQMQHILRRSQLHLEHQYVQNEEEVESIAMSIQKTYVYDIASGDTMRLLLLSCSMGDNYLVIGVHPLIMDATGIQVFLRWLAFHYNYPDSPRRVKQFSTASEQRHADYAAGKFEVELQYWREEFAKLPAPLPILTISKVSTRPALTAYENVTASCRIKMATKTKIASICQRFRTTPFHFYLAALRALLLRYTIGGEDVTTAVAENGRSQDPEEMEVIGPLYNLVLVRLLVNDSIPFTDLLVSSRDKTYAALANSNLPFPRLVEELKEHYGKHYTPFVQVFADYRSGQRERIQFGEENLLNLMGFDLNVPYDVYLDTIDEPNSECAHRLFLRKDLYEQAQAEELAASYRVLIETFATQPSIIIRKAILS